MAWWRSIGMGALVGWLGSGCAEAVRDTAEQPEFRACGEVDAECDGDLAEEEQCFLDAFASCVPATLGYVFDVDPDASTTITEYRQLRVVPTATGCVVERTDDTRQPGDDGSGSGTVTCDGARAGGPGSCRSVWAFGC